MDSDVIRLLRRARGVDVLPPSDRAAVQQRRTEVLAADLDMESTEIAEWLARSYALDGWPWAGPRILRLTQAAGGHLAGRRLLREVAPAVGGHGWTQGRTLAWQGSDPWLRMLAAASESSGDVLERLACDPCASVRAAVAGNPLAPQTALRMLSGDPDSQVRYELIENRAIPRDLWEWLAQRGRLGEESARCACREQAGDPDGLTRLLDQHGLVLPTGLPRQLWEVVVEQGEWHWATQPFPSPMSDSLLDSVDYLRGPVPDHLAVSHAGHGVNSYSLNIRLACGPLAALVQVGWGGVYGDSAADTQEWNRAMGALSEVLHVIGAGTLPGYRQRQVLVVGSDFRMPGEAGPIRVEIFEDDAWQVLADASTWDEVIDWLHSPVASGGWAAGDSTRDRLEDHLQALFEPTRVAELIALVAWLPSGEILRRERGRWIPLGDLDELDATLVLEVRADFLRLHDESQASGLGLTYADAEPYRQTSLSEG